MTREELREIPWLSLPAEVRKKVTRRYQELYGDPAPGLNSEGAKLKLAELSAYRLIKFFDGDVQGAIDYARTEGDYPASVIGSEPEEWKAAAERARIEIGSYRTDEAKALRGARIEQLVLEEMNKR